MNLFGVKLGMLRRYPLLQKRMVWLHHLRV